MLPLKPKPQPDGADEIALFREWVKDVTPLRVTNHVVHYTKKPKPIPMKSIEDEKQVLIDMFSDEYDPSDMQPGDVLSYCRAGIQQRVFLKLKRGGYRVASEIDLHGFNVDQARQYLYFFLQTAHPRQGECVRVIHGKGNRSPNSGPVLKIKISRWLHQHDRVLAYHSARPVDGGTGAVYILLKAL
ncbi:MAG: hypothetical protein RLZZ422_153 [Pseudomonadota bacterium]|jgi:DNA-nicking Smr family endonuclease